MSKGHSLVAALLAALTLVGAPAARADTAGLVAAYGFEEGAGSTVADATSSNPGTISGATRSTAGRFGSALSFDGVNDRVDVPGSASLDLTFGMTLEAWVRPSAGNWRTVVLKERPGGLSYALFSSTETNRPMAEISRGSMVETRGPSVLASGAWSHLATTYDGATLRLFVDGTQVSSAATSGAITLSSGALRIGGNAVWGEYFSGLIDEVRVYNRALTATELQADMNAAIDVQAPTAPAVMAVATEDDVKVTWTAATDNVGVTEYRIYRDGTLIGTRSPSAARELTDSDRPAGTYTYTVIARDAAGNESSASNAVSVTVVTDAEPPTASTLTATVQTGNDVLLTWTAATDNVAVARYRLYRGDTLIRERSASMSRQWMEFDRPAGTETYRIVAVDTAGNVSAPATATATIAPDGTPPTVEMLGDCSGTKLAHDRIEVAAQVTDVYGATEVRLELDGAPLHTFSGGVLSYSWNTRTVADGVHRIRAVARDAAGHEGESDVCEYKVFNPAISVANVVPASGATVRGDVRFAAEVLGNGEPLPVDGWYGGGRPVDRLSFSLNGMSIGSDDTAPYEFTTNTIPIAPGQKTLQVTAHINSAWAPSGPVTASSTFTLEGPPAPTGLTATVAGNNVELAWDPAPSGYGIQYWRVYRNGVNINAAVFQNRFTDANLPPGTYRYTINAGNGYYGGQHSTPVEVTVGGDTTPPTISALGTCNNATVRDTVTLHPTYADDSGEVTLTVKVDGTTIYEGSGGGSPLVSWNTKQFPNGTRTMTAVARDAAGNETAAPLCEWNVHNPVLSIPFTAPGDGETVSGQVTVEAEPREDGAATPFTGTVEFSGASGLGSVGSAPYQRTWDTTAVANGIYTLAAKLFGPAAEPVATSTRQVRVANVVPKPTLTATVVDGDGVRLSWTAPPASAGVVGHHAERDGAEIAVASGSATSYTDADRPPGTYRYRLIARNGGGEVSAPSDEVVVTVEPPAAPPGLVAAYAMDTAPGAVTDAVPATAGKFGGAFSFDGAGDFITIPDANAFDLQPGMTLEAWVRPSRVDDWRTVLLKERPGQLAYALYSSAEGGPWAEVTAGSQRHAGTGTPLPVNTWSHLAATYDRSTLRLYVNGIEVASAAVTGALFNSSGLLKIGGNAIWSEWFSGLIDEVRVYERALTAAEIQSDMTRPVAAG